MPRVASLAVAAIALGLGVPSVLADSASIDFKSPTYTPGSPNGQDGWSSTGSAGSGCAVYDHAIVANTYGYASFGDQSLRLSNAVTSGCFGDQTFSKSLVDEAGEASAVSDGLSGGTRQPYFEAEWEFASTIPGSEQPGLSVVASPDRGDGARISWVEMADAPAGLAVNFYDYRESTVPAVCDDNDFVFTNLVSGLSRTVPHKVKVTIEFVDGPSNDVVKVYVDGVLRHAGTSWEDYFVDCEGHPTRPVDSILFRTGGSAAPATAGNGFLIDNLKLFSGPLPLPPPPDCTGSSDCYVDDVNGNDANGGASFADAKKTIQAGIDAVGVLGTVHVAPGTYNESPVIAKSLQLVSSGGRDVTTIQLQAGPEYLGGLTIKGKLSQATVEGFTIAGSDGDASISRLANSNVVVYSGQAANSPSSVIIKDSRLKVANIDPGFTSGDDGIGILTYYNDTGTNEVDSIFVRGTSFEPLHGVGSTAGTRAFYINPGVKQFTFELNEITGQFNRGSYTQAKNALLDQNTVTGVGSPGSRSGGLGTFGFPDPTVYGHAVFRDNVIKGASGIHIYETENVTVTNNFLSNNDWGVSVGFLTALPFDASTIHIELNSITGTANGIESASLVTGTVNAERNWWGSASGPTNPGNLGGTGDKATGDVDFDPWLCDGTDTNLAAIGFQPNPNISPCPSLGSLTVTKTVNWSGAPPNTAQTFSICITGPSYPSGNCQTVAYNGGPLTWNGLDSGSYTVTENPGSAWTVAISGSPASVTGGQAAQASVTNTLRPGRLVVAKLVHRPFHSFRSRQTFEICVAGPSYATPNCRTIGPLGGLLVWSNIVPGTYTVTETNPGSDWVVTISGSPAVVPPNGTAIARVTNSKVRAAIAVRKDGPAIAVGGSAVTFTYRVKNDGNVALTDVAVADDKCSPVVYASGDVSNPGALDPWETWTYACTYTPTFSSARVTNTATATGRFSAQTVTATDTFTLHPLTLKKRVYLSWDVRAALHDHHAPADNTPFTVQAFKGNVLVGTYTIAQNAPQELWLSAGVFTFKEIHLPPGYRAVNSPIRVGAGQAHANEVTFVNVIGHK